MLSKRKNKAIVWHLQQTHLTFFLKNEACRTMLEIHLTPSVVPGQASDHIVPERSETSELSHYVLAPPHCMVVKLVRHNCKYSYKPYVLNRTSEWPWTFTSCFRSKFNPKHWLLLSAIEAISHHIRLMLPYSVHSLFLSLVAHFVLDSSSTSTLEDTFVWELYFERT